MLGLLLIADLELPALTMQPQSDLGYPRAACLAISRTEVAELGHAKTP